jgi:indolepyruvate ferredoxin oxidoreductase
MAGLAEGVTVRDRTELDAVQRELREVAGCTALIYAQTCATEKRRRRKRGTLQEPAKRVVINEAVCEGCGDCGDKSNCLSVEPVETEFGRKRRINQNSCNLDFSCVQGFCPSFVTVEGGQLRKPKPDKAHDPEALMAIPEPALPSAAHAWGIVVAGVGGTGVITLGQLLGMAAHLEGKGIVTQDAAGLAQKGGATWSHVQIADTADAIHTTKVDLAAADLVIACDAIVAALPATLAVMHPGRTAVALNTHGAPTAAFVHQPDWQFPLGPCQDTIAQAVGRERLLAFDAEQVAVKLLGDSLYTNPLLLGCAWQLGRIPLRLASLRRAIELNGVQVEKNLRAFEWGRRCAHDLAAVQALFQAAQVISIVRRPALEETVQRRVDFLSAYKDAAYAQRYREFVARVREAEQPLASTRLTEAVAQGLFKLMAYKDEYEVARLHADAAFQEQLGAMFEGAFTVVHHLAPPLLARKNARGELLKQPFGPWMRTAFKWLARLKGLRGTALDPFGRTAERHEERALIEQYRACIEELLGDLTAGKLALAVQIARIPQQIRGFGHVKARHLAQARPEWEALMHQWREGSARKAA